MLRIGLERGLRVSRILRIGLELLLTVTLNLNKLWNNNWKNREVSILGVSRIQRIGLELGLGFRVNPDPKPNPNTSPNVALWIRKTPRLGLGLRLTTTLTLTLKIALPSWKFTIVLLFFLNYSILPNYSI